MSPLERDTVADESPLETTAKLPRVDETRKAARRAELRQAGGRLEYAATLAVGAVLVLAVVAILAILVGAYAHG